MEQETQELRKYELMLILSGDLPESQFEKEMGEIRKSLTEISKIDFEDSWGRREFSYRLKRQNYGYYTVFTFHAAPSAIAEFRLNVKLNPVVLRHMLITVPEDYNPEDYKKPMTLNRLREDEEEAAQKKEEASISPRKKAAPIPEATEQDLKQVEKKLDEILDNPDIKL